MTRAAATSKAHGTWAKRPPAYQPQRCITLRPAVYDLLNARRAGRTWADYLCELAGVEPPQDRRRNCVRVYDTVNGNSFIQDKPDAESAREFAAFVNGASDGVIRAEILD